MGSETGDYEETTIQIRLSVAKKQEWLDYLNSESPHNTLTGLIKNSVSNRIDSKWVLKDKHESDAGDIPEGLDDALNNINDRLEAIETRLDEREIPHDPDNTPGDELEEHELRRLAFRVHEKLPVVQDAEHLKSLVRDDGPTLDVQSRPAITGTAQDISKVIDAPETHVRHALLYLERQETENIESIIHDSTRRWFERNPSIDREPPSPADIESDSNVDKEDVGLQPASELDGNGERE